MINIHNSQKKNLFTYVNTKSYPNECNEKEATFIVKTFEDFY